MAQLMIMHKLKQKHITNVTTYEQAAKAWLQFYL